MKKILIFFCLTINLVCFSATKSIVYNSLTYTIDTSSLTAILTGRESKDVNLNDLCIPDFVIDNDVQYRVTSIANKAFDSYDVKGTLTLGQNIEVIGYQAFKDCDIEGTLIIPNSVTSIGYYAFSGNSKITTLVIGKSVKEIGEYSYVGDSNYNMYAGAAFNACSGLERIICLASKAPHTWNVAWLNLTKRQNFSFYNVKLYLPADFSGDGSCSFYRSGNGTTKSSGEWAQFINKYVLEDSEFAGYLDGTYEEEGGNGGSGDQNGETIFNTKIDKYIYMTIDEEQSFSNYLPSGATASSWESSDDDIVEVTKKGKAEAYEYGNVIVRALDSDGATLLTLGVFVCPTVSIEYSSGNSSYQHHVIYNSTPSLYIAAPEGYEIDSVSHDGEDVTEAVNANDGYYTPDFPITDNSVISVNLVSTKDPADINGDGVVNVIDLNMVIERMNNY